MSRHSPVIRLQTARSRCNLAQECCPHFGIDGYFDGIDLRDCCYEVLDAQNELRLARRAIKESEAHS